jgi:hypothetical protein
MLNICQMLLNADPQHTSSTPLSPLGYSPASALMQLLDAAMPFPSPKSTYTAAHPAAAVRVPARLRSGPHAS